MGQELVAMSTREFDRLEVIRRVAERSLSQTKAAELVGLSERQVRRLGIAYAERGPAGLVSGHPGRSPEGLHDCGGRARNRATAVGCRGGAQPLTDASEKTALDRQLISDVYGLREALETTVVATLARSSRFDVRPFRNLIARGRTAVRQRDFRALVDLDMSFHTGLYEAAGNRVIAEVMRGQWSQIRRIMSMVLDHSAYRQKIWDEHQAIVEAIHARRMAAAVSAAGRHIRAAQKMLIETFDSRGGII
jgi:hypothetical protein